MILNTALKQFMIEQIVGLCHLIQANPVNDLLIQIKSGGSPFPLHARYND